MIELFRETALVGDRAIKEATVTLNGETVALFVIRDRQHLRAYINRCPHRWVPLNWQPDEFLSLDRLYIQCCLHGARFLIGDGLCISGPCEGRSLEALKVTVENGSVFLIP